jgi:argininosuccinate lyase
MTTLWHGRFSEGPEKRLMLYTESLPFDQRLYNDDIDCSLVHVEGLQRVGLLEAAEAQAISGALEQVRSELENKTFSFVETDEDIHTAIERRVTEIAGPTGGKLHTGRSRNDQIATATRHFCKRKVTEVTTAVLEFQKTLLSLAESAGSAYLPGYTHLQRAQPVMAAHHFAAHAWALSRDVDRLMCTRRRLDVSPLGAGALGGSTLALDPEGNAERLGFAAVFDNSMDAVSDRDFVADILYDLALLGVHLSRISEEVIVWSSSEFGFVTLDDAYSTGSSMLPQKKNPDIAELSRGKSGRLIGNLAGFLATLKGLPLAYNRDLQEDKEPLFDSLDQTVLALDAFNGMMLTARFNYEVMAGAADSPMTSAIDLAEWLVISGMPFRQAHAVVGECVQQALAGSVSLIDVVMSDSRLGPEAAELLRHGVSVTRRSTRGGGGGDDVGAQLKRLALRIQQDEKRCL